MVLVRSWVKAHRRMWKWEFVDKEEFRPRSTQGKITSGNDMEKLVVFRGILEVSQPRKRQITDIIWVQCYAQYIAGMADKYPEGSARFHKPPNCGVEGLFGSGRPAVEGL